MVNAPANNPRLASISYDPARSIPDCPRGPRGWSGAAGRARIGTRTSRTGRGAAQASATAPAGEMGVGACCCTGCKGNAQGLCGHVKESYDCGGDDGSNAPRDEEHGELIQSGEDDSAKSAGVDDRDGTAGGCCSRLLRGWCFGFSSARENQSYTPIDRCCATDQPNPKLDLEPEHEPELEQETDAEPEGPQLVRESEPEPDDPQLEPVAAAEQAADPHPMTPKPEPKSLSADAGHPFRSCLDRPYVQKELRWARQYQKKVIVIFETDERRAGFFDHGKAMDKYKGTEWEYILNIDAIPYQRDEDYADVMVAKIFKKAAGAVGVAAPPSVNEPGRWDFFLSHAQATGGDQTQTTSLRLKAKGKSVWYDNAMADRSTAAMEEGIKCCGCVILFLTAENAAVAAALESERQPQLETQTSAVVAPTACQSEAAISPVDDAQAAEVRHNRPLAQAEPEPEPQQLATDTFVAFREGVAEWAQLLKSQLAIPHGGLPPELPPDIRVIVTVLMDAEVPLLKQEGDPLRKLLAEAFHPGSQRVVVPVVDAAFTVDRFDGLPDSIRALARQHLVTMDTKHPERAIQSIRASIQHTRTHRLSATLCGHLETVIKETESFRDPCTQEDLSTETQCVPLRVITLKHWSDSMKAAYERSDASDLIILRRRYGYGDSVGYADRLGSNSDSQHREADVHFAEAQQAATAAALMPGAVILGPAASGKTTLLNRTACGYARDARCGYLGALVPYVIPVMQFSSWLIKNETSLSENSDPILEFICHQSGGKRSGLYREMEELFTSGQLCLIFDGLDEAGKKLQEIATYVGKTLGSSYSGRLIVSSRESQFDEAYFKHHRWTFLQIQPLTEQMQLDVLQRRFGGDVRQVSAFQDAQACSANLLEMGSNPLLLALMIGVFKVDKNKLPDRRTELYEKGVLMMVQGGSRNGKAAAAVVLPSKLQMKGRGKGQAKRKALNMDLKAQTLHALLYKIGHYLHVEEQQRDFQVFEITDMIKQTDWGAVSIDEVQNAWTDLQNEPRGLFMCTEVDPDGDGNPEKDWYRSTHLTFQEFFGAKLCVAEARKTDSVAAYFAETFTATPVAWLREVLLMTTELLSADEFEQVAKFYLDADDGSGACSVRVDQMLESRREDRTKGVGARITTRLSQTRSVEIMVKALRHPCEELRDLALTEIEKFRMPKDEVAIRLVDLAKPESALESPWYIHQAGIQSLGKLQVKSETVMSALVRIGFDSAGMQVVIKEALRAIKTLQAENSEMVVARVVELLNGTPDEQQFVWATGIKSIGVEHPLVIAALREAMGTDADVSRYLHRLDGTHQERVDAAANFNHDQELPTEFELKQSYQLPKQLSETQQIAATRSMITSLGSILIDANAGEEKKIDAVTKMLDTVNAAMPGLMHHVKDLVEQRGEFKDQLLSKIVGEADGHDMCATLCWTTQETAAETLQCASTCSPSDEVQHAFACIGAFEGALRHQSTLVLGIALQSTITEIGDANGDSDGDSGQDGGLIEDPFVKRLLTRLERSSPFAFAPLLHYFRSVLDPGADPTGERSEALRDQFDRRLRCLGHHSLEATFLRKELHVGKYEVEQPFWAGKIELQPALQPDPQAMARDVCNDDIVVAARDGDVMAVQQLLRGGTSPNTQDQHYNPVVRIAAFHGHVGVVEALCRGGADLEALDAVNGDSALNWAAANGHAPCVKLLLQSNAKVDVPNRYGMTALIAAAHNGRAECVQLLVKGKGDQNSRDKIHEMTALEWAQEYGHEAVSEVLSLDAESSDMEERRQGDLSVDTESSNMAEQVIAAVKQGDVQAVQALIQAGASQDAKNANGSPAIYIAAWKGHKQVVSVLVEATADPNVRTMGSETALMAAASRGHAGCVEALLEAKADVSLTREDGRDALMCAIRWGKVDCVELMVQAGALKMQSGGIPSPGHPFDGLAMRSANQFDALARRSGSRMRERTVSVTRLDDLSLELQNLKGEGQLTALDYAEHWKQADVITVLKKHIVIEAQSVINQGTAPQAEQHK